MLRIVVAAALVLISAAAYAEFNKCGRGICPGGMFGEGGVNTAGGSIPLSTGKMQLVDGASFILQTDGVSKMCRTGGC